MIDINEINSIHGNSIREAVTKFFVPPQTTRIINREAFNELSNATKALAKALKGHDLVPKGLLNEIYSSIQLLRNEAPYFQGEVATLEDMANELEMTLGLIMIGESCEDRIPGVPRII
jgi:hypothetical protein